MEKGEGESGERKGRGGKGQSERILTVRVRIEEQEKGKRGGVDGTPEDSDEKQCMNNRWKKSRIKKRENINERKNNTELRNERNTYELITGKRMLRVRDGKTM